MDLHPSENVLFSGHPSWRSTLGFYIQGLVVAAVVAAVVWFAASHGAGVGAGLAVLAVVLAVGFLRRMATHYVVTNERLHIRRGLLSRDVQETRLARVQNVNTRQSILERLLRVGTVDFDTAGTDDSDFAFRGLARPSAVAQAVDRAQRETAPGDATAGAGAGTGPGTDPAL
jgi:uncharacterized membrane protein YdbT with pleckstrin-like domain